MTAKAPQFQEQSWTDQAASDSIDSTSSAGSRTAPSDVEARAAWDKAVRAREAQQARIVQAFRQQIKGDGPGPTEADMLSFSRTAIAEQRLVRDLVQTRLASVASRR